MGLNDCQKLILCYAIDINGFELTHSDTLKKFLVINGPYS